MSVNMSIFGTHYPPAASNLNSLAFVINGTGAPGIYNSSYVSDAVYGTMNWCFEPGARSREYVVPPSNYTLAYVEVMQRHQKRTPYASNTFFKEDISWSCDDNGPYHYGRNASGVASDVAPLSWQMQHNDVNPWTSSVGPGFVDSSCQFPQMTEGGLEDAHTHGKRLGQLYRDELCFLSEEYDAEELVFRVTNNVITSQVGGALMRGYYENAEYVAAFIQPDGVDSLEPSFSCALASSLKSNYASTSNEVWAAHLNQSADLYAKLDSVSGTSNPDDGGWHTSFDHYYDNLSAKQCHSKSLPCSTNDTSICVTQDEANMVYRLGNWEYDFYWRTSENSTAVASLTSGPFMLELKDRLQTAQSGGKLRMQHNIAHDGSIAPLLGFLQVETMFWPGMGSEVIFEMYKGDDSAYYMRVLWMGQPMVTSTPLGTLDMIPLDTFIAYIDEYVPADLVATCALSA